MQHGRLPNHLTHRQHLQRLRSYSAGEVSKDPGQTDRQSYMQYTDREAYREKKEIKKQRDIEKRTERYSENGWE